MRTRREPQTRVAQTLRPARLLERTEAMESTPCHASSPTADLHIRLVYYHGSGNWTDVHSIVKQVSDDDPGLTTSQSFGVVTGGGQ